MAHYRPLLDRFTIQCCAGHVWYVLNDFSSKPFSESPSYRIKLPSPD